MIERKLAPINQSQVVLMDKFAQYLKQQGRDETLAGGYCNSLSLLWLYYALQGKEQEHKFLQRIKKIAVWDGVENLDTDFEKIFNHAEWLQRKRIKLFGLSSNDANIAASFDELPNESYPSISPIQQEHQFSFLFEKAELIHYVENLIAANPFKGFLIESHIHAVAVLYDAKIKKYRFFDSNNQFGVVEFSTAKDLTETIVNSLIFENIRLKRESLKKSVALPLNIRVIDIAERKLGKYPKEDDIVKKYVNDRLMKTGRDDLDKVGLDDATGLMMACKINNIKVANEILDSIKDRARKEKLVNTVDKEGWGPLKIALNYPLPLIELLVNNGASVSLDLIDYLRTLRISDSEKQPIMSFLIDKLTTQTLANLYQAIKGEDLQNLTEYFNQLNQILKSNFDRNEKESISNIFINSH